MGASELDDLAARLIAPLGLGDALLEPGDARAAPLRLAAITTDVALQYGLERAGASVCIEVVPRSGARAERVVTRHFAIGHRGGTMDSATALAACHRIAERIAANEDDALTELRARAPVDARVREVGTARALVACGATHYALSPYRGCTIGCRFCYAQSRLQPLRALLGLAAAPWGSWVDAHVDMPDLLAEELARLPCAPIKLCPIVADPYQAIERRLRVTRRCIEAITASPRPWSLLVLTRAYEILDDLELIATLPRAWVGVSLPTADDAVRRHFEPRAASVAERIEVLRRFTDAGVPTFAVVQPMLPGDFDALADALRHTTAGVVLGTLEGEEQAGALFDDYADERTAAWQDTRATRLREALDAHGIPVWSGELPPGAVP